MNIMLLIAGIIVAQVIIWVMLILWMKRRLSLISEQLKEHCSRTGDTVILGPASSNYRGAAFGYSRVRGNGVLCATSRLLIFQKIIGKRIEIPIAEISGITEAKWFRGKRAVGKDASHLIIHTRDSNEIGFLVREVALWKSALERRLREVVEEFVR